MGINANSSASTAMANYGKQNNNDSHNVGGQRKSTPNAVSNNIERTQKDVIIRKNSSKNLLSEKQNN